MASSIRTLLPLCCFLLLALGGCGGNNGSSSSGKLNPEDVRPALRHLSFKYSLWRVQGPSGNEASFRGRAHGPYDTTLEFSIGIGNPPEAVPVPGAGTLHTFWERGSDFAFNDDSAIGEKFKTAAQWREVSRMATEVNDLLCLAATDEHCPV